MDKFPKDLLGAVKKKTGKKISEGSIKKIAGKVTSKTVKSEKELRRLIKQVSSMSNIPVSEKTIQDIISIVKKSGFDIKNLETLMKMMIKKE